jgi:hypothetical protein
MTGHVDQREDGPDTTGAPRLDRSATGTNPSTGGRTEDERQSLEIRVTFVVHHFMVCLENVTVRVTANT